MLSDRIEKNIEDVLTEVVPPRSQTAPPRAGVRTTACRLSFRALALRHSPAKGLLCSSVVHHRHRCVRWR